MNTTATPQRRATDSRSLDIESMIAAEDDPRQRAFLIVLNNINVSLMANTHTTNEVARKLDEHLTHYEQHTRDEAAMINKGVGAWRVIAYVLAAVQTALVGGVGWLTTDIKSLHSAIHDGQLVDAQTAVEIKAIKDGITELRAREKP